MTNTPRQYPEKLLVFYCLRFALPAQNGLRFTRSSLPERVVFDNPYFQFFTMLLQRFTAQTRCGGNFIRKPAATAYGLKRSLFAVCPRGQSADVKQHCLQAATGHCVQASAAFLRAYGCFVTFAVQARRARARAAACARHSPVQTGRVKAAARLPSRPVGFDFAPVSGLLRVCSGARAGRQSAFVWTAKAVPGMLPRNLP